MLTRSHPAILRQTTLKRCEPTKQETARYLNGYPQVGGARRKTSPVPRFFSRPPLATTCTDIFLRSTAGGWADDFRFQISDFKFQISDFRFQISDSKFEISDFGFQISDFKFQISDFKFQIS